MSCYYLIHPNKLSVLLMEDRRLRGVGNLTTASVGGTARPLYPGHVLGTVCICTVCSLSMFSVFSTAF